MNDFTLRKLQEQQRPWVEHNFRSEGSFCPAKAHLPLLGVVEEVGELAHAHLKMQQGIRGTPEEHVAAAKDAVADIVIFLADFCSASGWDFQEIVQSTWEKVRQRDFRKNPLMGEDGG